MAFITSIDVVQGGASVHVTVDDQSGDALPPANITWGGDVSASGITITPDATGFLFAAGAGAAAGAVSATATYTGPEAQSPVSGSLTVNVEVGVTGLQFTSP